MYTTTTQHTVSLTYRAGCLPPNSILQGMTKIDYKNRLQKNTLLRMALEKEKKNNKINYTLVTSTQVYYTKPHRHVLLLTVAKLLHLRDKYNAQSLAASSFNSGTVDVKGFAFDKTTCIHITSLKNHNSIHNIMTIFSTVG